jgi:hypothetical protein
MDSAEPRAEPTAYPVIINKLNIYIALPPLEDLKWDKNFVITL